ncbi:CBS domain-containing protein [Streptomyces sp. NBC_00669]|uniref:CBS domain-containing protein n=1 Tax=Streptomyces sp. NBC_00669 TaxID=2976011 RepID=UPI003FA71CF1
MGLFDGLTPDQRTRVLLPHADRGRKHWNFLPESGRHGLPLGELDRRREVLAHRLIAESMSIPAYARGVRAGDQGLGGGGSFVHVLCAVRRAGRTVLMGAVRPQRAAEACAMLVAKPEGRVARSAAPRVHGRCRAVPFLGGAAVSGRPPVPLEEIMFSSPVTVEDVMTRTVVALGRDASFKEIVKTIKHWKVSALPVLEGEGRVVGVVSEADLLPKEEFRAVPPNRFDREERNRDVDKAGAVTAGQLMTAPAVCVHADSTLAQAARIMAVRGVKRLPVIDAAGKLRGIVSRSDLLKTFLRTDEEISDEVRHQVVDVLFPGGSDVEVDVNDGRVVLRGAALEPELIPLAGRLARAVEGVVDAECEFRPAQSGAPVT